jgi:hypothetical protein
MLAVEQGVPEALGMTPTEWANKHLGGRIKMEALQRREAVKEMRDDGMTQRQIGDAEQSYAGVLKAISLLTSGNKNVPNGSTKAILDTGSLLS